MFQSNHQKVGRTANREHKVWGTRGVWRSWLCRNGVSLYSPGPRRNTLFVPEYSQRLTAERTNQTKRDTTFNGGSLGSCIDEERSQLR